MYLYRYIVYDHQSVLSIVDIDHPVKFNLVVGSQRLHERRAKNQN